MTAKQTKKPGSSAGAVSPNNPVIPTLKTSPNNSHIKNAGIDILNVIGSIEKGIGHAATGLERFAKNSTKSSVQQRKELDAKFHERNIGNLPKDFNYKAAFNKAAAVLKGSSQKQTYNNPPAVPDSTYQWNLPPHTWSLPTEPEIVNAELSPTSSGDIHSTRRGRIWFYQGYVGPTAMASSTTGIYTPSAKTTPPSSNNKFGFQFVWNPETYSQTTGVNMSITPSASDPTLPLTGFAAANSEITFTLRLDRTNDFAAAKGQFDKIYSPGSDRIYDEVDNYVSTLASSYSVGGSLGSASPTSADINLKIRELLLYGTEADLEYLYKVINGDKWTGVGGRNTSNIGYLMPSLIRIDLGQQKFVGIISNISVNHLAFTKSMVPIRSDVNITVNLKANIQPTMNNGSSSTTGTK
jgi:hypothetical protein